MSINPPFSLRWNNYSRHLTNAFDSLRAEQDLVDVTLYCEGRKIKAHKLLLSACSTYFKEIFKENPCQHPVIIFKNVKYDDLFALIEFMYQGEVRVEQASLQSFLNTAEILSIQGLKRGDDIDGYGSVATEAINADKIKEMINNTDNSGKTTTTTTTTVPINIPAILEDSNSTETFEIPSETIAICPKQKETETQPQQQQQQQQQQQHQPKIIIKKYFSTSTWQQTPKQCENESEFESQEKQGMDQEKCSTENRRRPRFRRSAVWSHFKNLRAIEKAKCCICSTLLSYKGGSYSNLRNHLAGKHPQIDATVRKTVHDSFEEEQPEKQFKTVESDTHTSNDSGGGDDTSRNRMATTSITKRSGVWFHYKDFPSIAKARCCMCSKMISYKGGGLSNLRRHLRRQHPHIDISAQKYLHNNDVHKKQPEKQFNAINIGTTSRKQTEMTSKKHWVWLYYKDFPSIQRARCAMCSRTISYKGSLSNLRRHLKSIHPHIDINVQKCVLDNDVLQKPPPEKPFNTFETDTDSSNDSGSDDDDDDDDDKSRVQKGELDNIKIEMECNEAMNALEERNDNDRE